MSWLDAHGEAGRVAGALQYLTDADVVVLLQRLRAALTPAGILVLKENRPCISAAQPTAFLLDTPDGARSLPSPHAPARPPERPRPDPRGRVLGGAGAHGRYDITRPDAHHRLLFDRAGLAVLEMESGVETNFWVLR